MSVEECPYCGKPFKRLKSHLPHCKMAPVAQALKSIQTPHNLSKNTADIPKKKINKKISTTEKKGLLLDERQTSKDRSDEDKLSSLTNTEVTSVVSTERSKSKWFAKRLKESERLQHLTVSRKSDNSTPLSNHEGDKSFCNISNGQRQRESQANGKTTKAKKKQNVASLSEHLSITKSKTEMIQAIKKNTSHPFEWSLCHENPKLKRKMTDMKEIEPNRDLNLVSTVKELKTPSKTSVWDHIKGSFCNRSCNLKPSCPALAFETNDTSVAVQHSNKLETGKFSSTPSIQFTKTLIQQPVEDLHRSRSHGVRSLGWNPEIMTAYGILFSAESYRNSFNKNIWNKHSFSEPSFHSKVPLVKRKLADVRLSELAVWLGARSPETPREIATVLKQGWQWYYRKYIDVHRGGIGGISLLIAGYCVLCYIWRYPHLKKERWRKYH